MPNASSEVWSRLTDSSLLQSLNLIDGAWTAAQSGNTHAVVNPSNQREIAVVAASDAEDARLAVQAAFAAGPAWASKPAKDRATILRKWRDSIVANSADLGLILAAEQGKPLRESIDEVLYGASFVGWFAEEALRAYGDTIPSPSPSKRIAVVKQPIGVAALITPWNFPSAMITRKAGPALAAGCTVVLKPAEDTPLSALALGELALRSGLPPGVLNIVTTAQPAGVGEVLTTDPRVRKLSFTGSTRIGKMLMQKCASTVKRVSLELGGNAAFIVFEDADVDAAVEGIMAAKFRNTGQTCISANRIFVHEALYETLTERLTHKVGELVVGDALAEGSQQGPLINEAALHKVTRLVEDALAHGARLLIGGTAHSRGGWYFQPTVLCDVPSSSAMQEEEIFGPVAALQRFSDEKEVVALANATPYGLASYFYSRDIARCWRVAEMLEVGMVGINDGSLSTEVAPFGGIKESGFGREGSKYGIAEYQESKYISFGGI
ncbi:NAD-dependent succinate-semialdehyde dehydrogenase [Pseudorhodoferax sp. Leaf265]|uniref:NAD-dependent succinate-semialdehyde dehydrogenase n=1 Tax=Pseudorhodoferax sp. Leaf265 TaxID=1736315 RepID=UPI0009EB0346|nr:NAD-dependent succinate-semialdehyde dehydrogenase [Pseudorhodoferax sp. Leaf265]